jgi:hypothetical protein
MTQNSTKGLKTHFMKIKFVELDELIMAFGSMASARACKSSHLTITTEGSQCKISK